MSSKAYEIFQQIKDLSLISGTADDDLILQKMNLSQWKIFHTHYPWTALEDITTVDTVDGQAYNSFPSTMGQLLDVVQADTAPYQQLKYLSPDEFHKKLPQPTQFAEGKPTYYTWFAGKFWWYPIPDDEYELSISIYKKPVSLKVYSAETAAHSGTTVTGTSTKFKDNANVDTAMFFAYTADKRSDGTYPWSAISAIASNTSMTIATYTGATATGAYACSSELLFPEEFDLLLVYETCLLLGGRSREIATLVPWLTSERDRYLGGLIDSQRGRIPFKPVLEDFQSGGVIPLGDYAAKYPFIKSDL